MAEADKDGRMAQWLGDRMTILGMEINESIRDKQAELDALLGGTQRRMWSLNLPDWITNPLFRRLRRVPEPVYYWLLDRLTDNNGWRPLSMREGWKR